MNTSSNPSISGVILAGGKGQRMGGQDKGLVLYQHQPLISYVIEALRPQVDTLIINANRNIDLYQQFSYPVVKDSIDNYCGPLAGMLSAMKLADTDYILTAPCDSPHISAQLRQRLMETMLLQQADLAVAHDGERLQPVFCLLPCHLHDDLQNYLQQGGRKIDLWLNQHKMAVVDFSDQVECFSNFNRPEDIAEHTQVKSPIPLLGFAAFSGTGKTTLLQQLIPALNKQDIQVAVIKHAHHKFDIDVPGKDSYEIRKAGAQQMLVSSSNLMALMEVQADDLLEPKLADLIPRLNTSTIDLILVEGFKHENLAKIELYRPSLNKPLLHPDDSNIVAIASDEPLGNIQGIDQLDLNNIDQMADYIHSFITHWTA